MAAKRKASARNAASQESTVERIESVLEAEFKVEIPPHEHTWFRHHARQLAIVLERLVAIPGVHHTEDDKGAGPSAVEAPAVEHITREKVSSS